ncbi:MAG: GntR family transcriptional regulator [Cellvibrionaceae bacterium]|nr:GntR family transcriptional regulator [Cellvibrionaceae bacterium]|tara:strand:+ start:1453 stop:2964 length:1512 start_codon:yes stop_codon:yes gene_type:complete
MVPVVSDLLLNDLQMSGVGSLQQQLYQQLHRHIVGGRLVSGARLPSSRQLAQSMGLSRNTVSLVLDQLKAEGYLESHMGRGVFVSTELPSMAVDHLPDSPSLPLPELSSYADLLGDLEQDNGPKDLPFAPGIPDVKAFPMAIWARIMRRHVDRLALQTYDSDQGYQPLREALTHYLRESRGVRCDSDQIVITQGAQQAISLCAQVLLNRDDPVLLEESGYRGARTAFEAHQCRLMPAMVRNNVLDVAALPSTTQAKLLYVTPTHHYPLGGILSASDRLRLLQWAASAQTWILEDDYDSEFNFVGKPVAALQGMAAQTPVIYMGSFSKTLLPALRLGYLVVPKALASVFTKAKNAMSGETPLLTQAAVAEFLEEGHFVRHLRKMRRHYHGKWRQAQSLLEQYCGEHIQIVAESAGMHLVICFEGVSDRVLAREFYKKGYGSTPLSSYQLVQKSHLNAVEESRQGPNHVGINGLVLGFSNTTEQQRIDGIKTLSALIKKLTKTGS